MDEEALPRKILAGELHYAKLWLVCVALRGVSWDKMPFEQRELAFQAKDAASNCISNLLNSPTYRAALRYAVHDSLVTAAFSGLFLLKMANLFPAELDLNQITVQVEQLAQLLSDVAAERSVHLPNYFREHSLTPFPQVCFDSTHHAREPPSQDGLRYARRRHPHGRRSVHDAPTPAVPGPQPRERRTPCGASPSHLGRAGHALANGPRGRDLQSEQYSGMVARTGAFPPVRVSSLLLLLLTNVCYRT